MSAGMQPTNVGGLGAGNRPTQAMVGQSYGLATPPELFRQQEAINASAMGANSMPNIIGQNVVTQTGAELTKANMGNTYSSNELAELQAEFDRQEKLRLAQQQQFAELAQGSGQRATAPSASRVGGGGGGQMTPLNPAAIPKKDDDILTAPFLGRWRNR